MTRDREHGITHQAESLSRRKLLALGAAAGAGAGLLAALPDQALAAGPAPRGKRLKVIFVVHDNNPFFVPVRFGFEQFGRMAGWQTQWVGPSHQSTLDTVNLQASALAAHPTGVIFTRIDASSFDANIRRAQQLGIKIILSNVASTGYQKLGVGFVGQDFIPAGVINGLQAARYAQQLTGRTSGVIVCTNGAPGNSALEERIIGTQQGVQKYNKQHGTSYTTTVLVTSFTQSEAIGRVDAEYTRYGSRIVGWAHAGIDHQFTAAWAAGKGLTHKFAIGGFDLIPPILADIKKGTIQWTIGQNPYAQGFVASALLSMEIDPGYPAYTYDTGAEVVDASTIAAVIKRERRFGNA